MKLQIRKTEVCNGICLKVRRTEYWKMFSVHRKTGNGDKARRNQLPQHSEDCCQILDPHHQNLEFCYMQVTSCDRYKPNHPVTEGSSEMIILKARKEALFLSPGQWKQDNLTNQISPFFQNKNYLLWFI